MARGRYFLVTTTRCVGFRNFNWTLTFSICAAWSFTVATKRATVLSNSVILLLLLEFVEFCLGLRALGSAYSHLLPTGIDKDRA